MDILSSIPALGKIVDKGLGIVDQFVEDRDKANQLKTEIKKQIEAQSHESDIAELKSQTAIVKGEVRGESWLQRNWRPLLMLVIILIIANNYILVPYLSAIWPEHVHTLDLPSGLWALLNVGVGGYVTGRTGEKVVRDLKKGK